MGRIDNVKCSTKEGGQMKKAKVEDKIYIDILTGHQRLSKGFSKLKKEGTTQKTTKNAIFIEKEHFVR